MNLKIKVRQLKSALEYGGPLRIADICLERFRQGYSTRFLSYSWPKKLHIFKSDSARKNAFHFFIPHLRKSLAYGGINSLALWALRWAREGHPIHFVITDFGGDLNDFAEICGVRPSEWDRVKSRFSLSDFSAADHVFINANESDNFVVSAWWTMQTLRSAAPTVADNKIYYIIQDFEPLFYDCNDPVENKLHELARKSYEGNFKAIINSKFLKEFLLNENILNPNQITECFAPLIDPQIFFKDPKINKAKTIFVYARPDVRRNRFDLCIETLKLAAAQIPKDWLIVGGGSLKEKIDLGNGHVLRPIGKLPITDYAALLRRCSVGLCLMESPHPSYPPLELASCGARVVCNRYANKDYSILGPEYFCTDLNASKLSDALITAIKESKFV